MTHVNPVLRQNAFRGREDSGNEATPTWIALANTNWSQSVNEDFRVRFVIQETANSSSAATVTPLIQFSVNGGAYAAVGTTTAVKFGAFTGATDNDATTQQLGSGSFVTGRLDSNGSVTTADLQNSETEYEYCLNIDGAQVSNNDTITLRVYDNTTALDQYGVTPSITAVKTPTLNQERWRIRTNAGNESTATWLGGSDTNLITSPRDLTNGTSWDRQVDIASTTANTWNSPLGGTLGDSVTTGTLGTGEFGESFTYPGSVTYNISVYCAKTGHQWARLRQGEYSVWFDVVNGVEGSGTAIGSPTNVAITDEGSAYRISYAGTPASAASYWRMIFSDGDGSATESTNSTLQMDGWQATEGSALLPYIDGSTLSLDANTSYRVRIGIEETGGASETLSPQLWFQVNTGSWTQVGTTTAVKRATLSGTTDGTATTEQLTGGSVSFVAGSVDDNGTISDVTLSSQATELEFCFEVDSAQVSDGDTINLRVYDAGSVLSGSYNATATFTVAVGTTTNTITTSLDSALKKSLTLSTSLDSALQVNGNTISTALEAHLVDQTWGRVTWAELEVAIGGLTATTFLDSTLQGSFTISTAVDAVLVNQVSISTSIDAALEKTFSVSTSIDSALQDSFSVTTSLDAALQDTFSVTTALDAVLQKEFSVTTSLDAVLQKELSVATSVDATLEKTFSVSTSLDAVLEKTFSVTTSLDATLEKTISVTTAIDAHLIAIGSNTITTALDAALQDSFSITTSADAALEKTFSVSTSLDSALEKTLSVSTSLDSALEKTLSVSTALQAHLIQVGTNTIATSIDAALQDSFSVTTSIDSALEKTLSVSTSLDAVLQKEFSVTTFLDATLEKTLSVSTSIDAHLIQIGTNVIATALDAALQDSFSITTSVDAVLSKEFSVSTSVDATLQKEITASTSLDAALQDTLSISSSLDAALEKTFTASTATDAVLQKEISVSTSLDFRALAQDVTLTTSLDARLIGLDAATARSAEPNNAKNTITVSGSLNQIDITGTPNKIDITATPNKVI